MKKKYLSIVLILFAALIVIQCSGNKNSVVNESHKIDLNSRKVVDITLPENGNFILPEFSYNDSSIFFLSSDFSSIWMTDLSTRKGKLLYKSKNKISEFVTSPKSSTIFAIEKSFNPRDKVKSRIVKVTNEKNEYVLESEKSIDNLFVTKNENLVFILQDSIKFFDSHSKLFLKKLDDNYELITIDSTQINFIANSRSDKINLTNHQNVAWVEKISADSILIYSAQDKLILLSLRLKDIVRLGDYQNPKYNSSQKLLAFLKTSDDGLNENSSDIFFIKLGEKEEINITNSPNELEHNIKWSHDRTKLAFDTNGQIKIISFDYKKPRTK